MSSLLKFTASAVIVVALLAGGVVGAVIRFTPESSDAQTTPSSAPIARPAQTSVLSAQTSAPKPITGAATASAKPFFLSKCTKTPIGFQTDYIDNSSLYVGDTKVEYRGMDGWVQKCIPGSDGFPTPDTTQAPINALVSRGVKPLSTPVRQVKDYSVCNQFLGQTSSAYDSCIHAVNGH